MIDILLEILGEVLDGTDFVVPVLVLLAVIVGIIEIHHRYYRLPIYLLRAAIWGSICLFALVVLTIIGNQSKYLEMPTAHHFLRWILVGKALIMIAILLLGGVCIGKYVGIRKALRMALYHAQTDNFEHNSILAWRELDKLKPSEMTQKQQVCFDSYRMYLRAILGNFSANEYELEKLEKGDNKQGAFCHLLRFVQCWSEGEMKKAAEHIKKAEELCDADTDELIYSQILINRGVSYVSAGMYKDADDAFCRAIHFCEQHKLKDTYLWVTIYYNYIFNKTRLNPEIQQTEWKSILDELKTHLDMEKPTDYMAYSNVELELLRQTNADRKQLEDNVYYAFDYLQLCDVPTNNRCVFEGSIARIIWAARLDPTYILEALTKDIDHLLQLPMPARYHCFKDIDLFFADLHGNIVEDHDRLKQTAYWYMTNQAAKDLEDYRRDLPSEAIYERCFCFQEIAGLQKRKEDGYQWSAVKEQFENAMSLYRENGLELQENMCKLNLVDEAICPLNMDEHFRIVKRDEMKQLLEELERWLPKLEKHPMINEVALRLSLYCCRMDDYKKCKYYYELYKQTSKLVSMNHYAPWIHRYYMVVCFVVRVLYFMEAVHTIPNSAGFHQKNELVRGWFEGFFDRNGESESYILGRLLGFENQVTLKRVVWTDSLADVGDSHVWMVFRELGLEIDVTYKNFREDDDKDVMFFCTGQHPMENGQSNFIRKKKQDNVRVQVGEISIEQFQPVMQDAMREICEMLEEALPPQCPSIQELQKAFKNVMLPVGLHENG